MKPAPGGDERVDQDRQHADADGAGGRGRLFRVDDEFVAPHRWTIPVKGLDLPATIARDDIGVPHVTARSVRDAYFAIGWSHAQDRLWQMELQRRTAAGRLAEAVGEAGLANDRFIRTLGLRRLAEHSLDKLDKPTRDVLQVSMPTASTRAAARSLVSPAAGIPAARPQPWSWGKPADSLAIGRLLALQLTNDWRAEILRGVGQPFRPAPTG